MNTNAIARRYAKALVQLGSEEKNVEKFQADLIGVEAVFTANPELVSVLSNPAHGIEAKREILKGVIGKLSLSATVANFLLLLLDKNRLDQLSEIVASYGVFADEMSGVIRPTLTTALPLETKQVDAIKQALEKGTGKMVVLKVKQDPSLIGGVITEIDGKVFDGSVKTQLAMIQDILQKG